MKKNLTRLATASFLSLLVGLGGFILSSCGDDSVPVVNPIDPPATPTLEVEVFSSLEGTGTVTWSSDSIYVLKGLVFVNDGQVLTIEAGTNN